MYRVVIIAHEGKFVNGFYEKIKNRKPLSRRVNHALIAAYTCWIFYLTKISFIPSTLPYKKNEYLLEFYFSVRMVLNLYPHLPLLFQPFRQIVAKIQLLIFCRANRESFGFRNYASSCSKTARSCIHSLISTPT